VEKTVRRNGGGSDPGDLLGDLSKIDAFGKNEQAKKVVWAVVVAIAGPCRDREDTGVTVKGFGQRDACCQQARAPARI